MLCTKHTPEIGFANRVLACLCAIALQPCGREFPLTSANPYIFPIPSFSTWFIRLAQRISSPPSIHVSVSSPRSIKFYRFISSRLLSRQQHQTPIKHQASLLKSLCSPASLAHSLRSTRYYTSLHYTHSLVPAKGASSGTFYSTSLDRGLVAVALGGGSRAQARRPSSAYIAGLQEPNCIQSKPSLPAPAPVALAATGAVLLLSPRLPRRLPLRPV